MLQAPFQRKLANPLNSQAWAPNSQPSAPSDPDTFEARWRARTVFFEEAASVTDAGSATPEVDGAAPVEKNRQAAVSLQHTGKDPHACDCSRSAASSTDRTTPPQRETPGGALPWSFSKCARIARRQSCLGETIRLQGTRIASIRATNSGRTVLALTFLPVFSDASSPPRAYPSVENNRHDVRSGSTSGHPAMSGPCPLYPNSGHRQAGTPCPLSATTGLYAPQQNYSITSTGRSDGFAPLRILST